MTYYPKSQITENLFTNGDEYTIKSSGKDYRGYYWSNSSGKYFTGKTPQDKPNEELIKIEEGEDVLDLPQNESFWTETYNNTLIQSKPGLSPIPYKSSPTSQDYTNGYFIRYFSKKTNQNIYIEINKKDFDLIQSKSSKILWQLYQPISVVWQLSGDEQQVFKANRNNVLLVEKQNKLPGFNKIFKKEYSKFYKNP